MHDTRAQYNVFGTSASPKTLTGSFVADPAQNSGVVFFDGFREVTLNLSFTTGSGTGEFCQIQVETSNDITSGNPTNWFIWGEDATPDASPPTKLEVGAIPYQFPVDVATPASATTYNRSYSFKVQARWLRFKVKSTAGSSFGTAWLQALCSER